LLLNYTQIKELLNINSIKIEPFDEELQLQSSSIDLRTSDRFFKVPVEINPQIQVIDPKNPYLNILEKDYISDNGIILEPKEFILIETLEFISMPENIAFFIQPKYRLVKLGIQITNSGWIEYGFEGNLTLCLFNSSKYPVKIFKEMNIAHIFLIKNL